MKASHTAAFLSLAALAAPLAQAADVDTDSRRTVVDNQRFSGSLFTGTLHNKSQERVFTPDGNRLSQLNWRTASAPVIGADFRFRIDERWTWDTQAWTKVASGGTRMRDYDFEGIDEGLADWTDRSTHPQTTLRKASGIDTRVGYTFASTGDFSFRGLAGYRYKELSWDGNGGSGVYSSQYQEADGFRDTVEAFDGKGITYTQRWRAPYLGIATDFQRGKWTVSGELTGSLWARGTDRDNHIPRNYISSLRGGNSKMIGASVKADYAIDSRWSLSARTSYEKYYETRGTGRGTLEGEPIALGASAANRSMMFNVGATYRF
ncbi:MAG: Coagulase/fibrinolysin [Luteibacter sp.]|uniref:omptin family outer membrane protease n=1 Tax=Luteibacter sp. TaxID=1886636 RepID=UPI0013848307|nr:omptin family outer membrane protease [Luteibacter sp.]KAF1004548.1 MAG: Coagulase/fibrinolysin [Luteibacter sp.]